MGEGNIFFMFNFVKIFLQQERNIHSIVMRDHISITIKNTTFINNIQEQASIASSNFNIGLIYASNYFFSIVEYVQYREILFYLSFLLSTL